MIRLSAKALLGLLSGSMTKEEWDREQGNIGPHIKKLAAGKQISGVKFEPAGDSADDDHIVVELEDDVFLKSFREVERLV